MTELTPAHMALLEELDIVQGRRPGRPPSLEGRPGAPKKSHCKRGHELAGGNLKIYTTREGYTARECLDCKDLREQARKARRVPRANACNSSSILKAKEATNG